LLFAFQSYSQFYTSSSLVWIEQGQTTTVQESYLLRKG